MNGEPSLATFARALTSEGDLRSNEGPATSGAPEFLDGDVKDFVYRTLTLPERRQHGIFFSGAEWAKRLCARVDTDHWKRFVDPSVGTGDLLVELCQRLPLESSITETLTKWSSRLIATDLRASFLQIAWTRIQAVALARHRNNDPYVTSAAHPLPTSFKVGDALSMQLDLCSGDCIIMNPPYQRIVAPPGSFVGKGQRSAAALHIERMLLQAPPGVCVVALLPDVLRSGSSYQKFRHEIGRRLCISSFDCLGGFGPDADIDVSILFGITEAKVNETTQQADGHSDVLADKFTVRVGPVVPHRTSTDGIAHAYLTVKNSVVGAEVTGPTEIGSFKARLEKGPFVIVRRTSSPSDKTRARATLVSAKTNFFVENHLLVLSPINNSVKECRKLMKVLQDPRTNEWLNRHIRCRHLTVGALKALPWLDIN